MTLSATEVILPGVEHGTVAVLVPAHNEADQLGDTIASLRRQTLPPNLTLVISDNSTDDTVGVARRLNATVTETVGNTFKKAGALNHGIRWLLEKGRYFPEFVITIDADTVLDDHFIERAVHAMRQDPTLGGLSAVCRGKPKLGRTPLQKALSWVQRAEYVRAGFVRIRQNVHTLSGAGSVLRAEAIYDVLRSRGVLYIEHPDNLVEDFEATLEVKKHGWRCTNNFFTVAFTDLMVTPRTLMRQRLRWVGGTINELRRRGWHRETRASISTVIYGFAGIPVYYMWLVFLGLNLRNGATWLDLWFMLFVAIFQAVTLRRMGWKSMFVGFLLIPEMFYMTFRHIWLISSLVRSYAFSHPRREWE